VLNVNLRSGAGQFSSGSREAVATLGLEDLRSKHRELLLAIDEMLSLLVSHGFDAESYYAARIRLMQASSERHWLWRRIFDYRIGRLGLIDAETLKRLPSRALPVARKVMRRPNAENPTASLDERRLRSRPVEWLLRHS
jgi:hypothetical protein